MDDLLFDGSMVWRSNLLFYGIFLVAGDCFAAEEHPVNTSGQGAAARNDKICEMYGN
jgi:hypothetical protein